MVKCAAEGMEKGMFMRGSGSKNAVPERFKVVSLLALAMCLCNADRVVMSVAVVPLAADYGWSSSFLGIVQVPFQYLIFQDKLSYGFSVGNEIFVMGFSQSIKREIWQ